MANNNLVKISIRVEPDVLKKIDGLVDHIIIKNRSDSVRSLVKKAIRTERTAVILSKGTDTKYFNIDDRMKLENGEYNITAKLPHGRTLVEEQIDKEKYNLHRK